MVVGIVAEIGVPLLGVITVIEVQFWIHKKKIAEMDKDTILLYFYVMFKWISNELWVILFWFVIFILNPFLFPFGFFIALSELMGIIDRPDVFSYAKLRAATDAFDIANISG
jgi:hypothetical protein